MGKSISKPLEQTFKLDKFDETGDTTATIRQATQRQQMERDILFEQVQREYRTDPQVGAVQTVKNWPSAGRLMELEVRLTLADCNILGADEQTPLFKFNVKNGRSSLDLTPSQFAEAWGQLPAEVAIAIHECVLVVNPQWGAAGEK